MRHVQQRVQEVSEQKVKISLAQVSSLLLESVELMYEEYLYIDLGQLQKQGLVYLSDFK